MSSLVRRMQRMQKRKSVGAQKRSMGRHFGDKVGVHNATAKDLIARLAREEKRKENVAS